MSTLLQDLRYAIRSMLRSPGFALAAIAALALGIGANAAIFGMINVFMLRPMEVPDSDRLVRLLLTRPRLTDNSFSYPDFADYRDSGALSGVLAHRLIHVGLSEAGESEVVYGELVSGNYFDVLGVRPNPGRGFLPEEDRSEGSHPVAVISRGLWSRRFGSDPAIAGRTVQINGRPFTIVGVTPESFKGTKFALAMDIWIPVMMHDAVLPGNEGILESRGSHWIETLGRMAPGQTIEQAEASLRTIARRLEEAHPETNANVSVHLVPESLGRFPQQSHNGIGLAAILALSVVGLVLLIACANVANLLLARAIERRRELGIRLALGASRGRVVRQLLTESLILAVLGGAGGLLLSFWTSDLALAFIPPLPYTLSVHTAPDGRVLAFTLAISLLTAFVFGLVPALQATRPELVSALRNVTGPAAGGRRRITARSALVVAQVALSLMVLGGAALFLRSLQNASRIDTGFDRENVLLASMDVSLLGYSPEQGRNFYDGLVERIGSLPGIRSTGLTELVPLGDSSNSSGPVVAEGHEFPKPGEGLSVGRHVVAPGYFRTMGIPIVRGRDFAPDDRPSGPALIIVNQTLARILWGAEDPIGRRLQIGSPEAPYMEVLGVARDGKYRVLGETPQPYLYRPQSQSYRAGMTLLVRTEGDPENSIEAVRREVKEIDARLPLYDIKTLTHHMKYALWWTEMGAGLSAMFGLLGLTLAAVGVYGVVSRSVTSRTREIGIRMALGARRSEVLGLVMGQGAALTLVGVAAGLAGAIIIGVVMRSLLYGVSPVDPAALAGTTLLLGAVALAAACVPAWRATRVDPASALRCE